MPCFTVWKKNIIKVLSQALQSEFDVGHAAYILKQKSNIYPQNEVKIPGCNNKNAWGKCYLYWFGGKYCYFIKHIWLSYEIECKNCIF
jgi:hypothetical protein